MRNHFVSLGIQVLAGVFLVSGAVCSYAAQPIKADDMGLSKTSVFDTPTPKVYQYGQAAPGLSKLLPRAYLGAPPQVSHDIADFLPITAQINMCAACHNQPALWGKKVVKGAVIPIPQTHYMDHRNAPGKVTANLINARYNCNQCHVPQTNAPALVENTFFSGRAR